MDFVHDFNNYFSQIKEESMHSNHFKKEQNTDSELIIKRNCLVIIDDDETSSSVLKLFAGNFFNEIHVFPSTEESLTFLSKNKVDMIISDYFIPGKNNGSNLAPVIKRTNPDITYIIASGQIENISDDKNLIFVDNFIEKPYIYKEFIKTIS
jgi:two-component SAPR family response regulator